MRSKGPLPDHLYSCSNAACPVDFLKMTLGGHHVRRLSTDSTVSKIGGVLFATKWCWYWLDEYGKWIEYSSEVCRNSLSNKNFKMMKSCFSGILKFSPFPPRPQSITIVMSHLISWNKPIKLMTVLHWHSPPAVSRTSCNFLVRICISNDHNL